MYFVPDKTCKCGYYECANNDCGQRFLSTETSPRIECPYCAGSMDMEFGPDDNMEELLESARLVSIIEGEEEIEKMDTLLSLAITGGDFSWI